jgi:dolichyl-diphosphooligosaccharide--protein glycosyltransferase
MSWWDYGHWITAEGERIPVANPFQQGSDVAAKFLTAQTEEEAQEVLTNLDEDDAQTRYVMVDWKMAATETQTGGKYFAPLRFDPDTNRSEHYTRVASIDNLQQSGLVSGTDLIRHNPDYYNSTTARLYWYHGSAKNPDPVVVDWQGAERALGNGDTFVEPPSDGQPVKRFRGLSALQNARAFVENDSTSQLGGVGAAPTHRIPALEHYRLVYMDEVTAYVSPDFRSLFQRTVQNNPVLGAVSGSQNATADQQRNVAQDLLYGGNTPSWTKTFERVPGATIEGTDAPENTTLRMQVELNPANGQNFTYHQQIQTDENGEFTTTVPYATTGYDEVGVEDGYTNTSVRATGPYQFGTTFGDQFVPAFNASVDVTESQVVGESDATATVEGNWESLFDDGNGTDGNSSDNATDGSTTDPSTDDSTTDDSATNDSTSGGTGGVAQTQQAKVTTAVARADRAS